ncbi:MAG TPA: NAD-dependent epimerase/dehydratase family protein [Thermoanaerobaculia bacterium]|nr:NAD-dependent epimerase/dehydratase family protein [Thermoanaerobaculia bacterium]
MIVADAGEHRILLFGAGLIGNSILEALSLRTPLAPQFYPFSWNGDHAIQLARIEHAATSASRMSIIWSAGRVGFNATTDEVAQELGVYRDVLRMSARLASRIDGVAFHLISSAGGLFEGQRHVTSDAIPRPRRAYGHLKLQQEIELAETNAFAARRVYRVSSAYGPLRPNIRAGLVATLLLNAARREVTHITGRMETLRDFVFSGDIGAYVADAVLARTSRDVTDVLASGRPCSLREVQAIVERVVGRRLHVTFARDADNAEDITFDGSVLPRRWDASDLRWNVSRIYREAVSAGVIARCATAQPSRILIE